MCTKPLSILNPRKKLSCVHGGFKNLRVPCGHCPDCDRNKGDSWILRCTAELQDLPSDGFAIFDTLTYKDAAMPHVGEFLGNDDDRCCFRQSDLTEFLDRLSAAGLKYRYLLSEEYGGITHRAHYHILLFCQNKTPEEVDFLVNLNWRFFNKDIPYSSRFLACQAFCRNRIAISHQPLGYGFTDLRAPSERVLKLPQRGDRTLCKDSSHIVAYVSQYVCKDDDFAVGFKSEFTKYYKEQLDDETFRKAFNQLRPRVRCSLGFGESLIHQVNLDDVDNSFVVWDEIHQLRHVNTPLYLKNRLFYDYKKVMVDGEKKVRRFLNDIGARYKATNDIKSCSRMSDTFKAFQVHPACPDYFRNLDPDLLALYAKVYQYRFIPADVVSYYMSNPTEVLAADFLAKYDGIDCKSYPFMIQSKGFVQITQHFLPEFAHFDDFLLTFDAWNKSIGLARMERYRELQLLKKQYKKKKYYESHISRAG